MYRVNNWLTRLAFNSKVLNNNIGNLIMNSNNNFITLLNRLTR